VSPFSASPFQIVYRDALPHGILIGVALPERVEDTDAYLTRLHPAEAAYAQELRGHRKMSFVGGRIAARAAIQSLGRDVGPLLSDPHGAPILPVGVGMSISHKRHLAVAMASRVEQDTLGVDLETIQPSRMTVASHVLTENERADVDALPESRRWTSVLLRFSLKESIYKALAPKLVRFIDFSEAEVSPDPDGTAAVKLLLREGAGPLRLDARYIWVPDGVLTSVRARWS
jgi:phosphopantetheine--protein transferase-like protein